MQRIPFCGADLSDRDVERLIERAKIARSEFLRDNCRRVFGAFGLTALACGFAVLLILGAGSTRHQVLEKTALMERLATTLADARMIPPKTVQDIAQLIRQPQYDCRQLACDEWLERRNLAARARLEMILARDALPDDVADNNLSS